jgi:hypothetical protein
MVEPDSTQLGPVWRPWVGSECGDNCGQHETRMLSTYFRDYYCTGTSGTTNGGNVFELGSQVITSIQLDLAPPVVVRYWK